MYGDRRLQPRVSAHRKMQEGTKLSPDAPCPPRAGPCPPSWSPRVPCTTPSSRPVPISGLTPPSGMAGSVSSPHPHFPIQDIWVASTERRLICPLIPQPGGCTGP